MPERLIHGLNVRAGTPCTINAVYHGPSGGSEFGLNGDEVEKSDTPLFGLEPDLPSPTLISLMKRRSYCVWLTVLRLMFTEPFFVNRVGDSRIK